MRTKCLFMLVALSSALIINGCAAFMSDQEKAEMYREQAKEDLYYYAKKGRPVPLYQYWTAGTNYTYYGEDLTPLRGWIGAYTLADYDIDKLIAGERQGNEKSFYLTAVSESLKKDWERLPDGEYGPAILSKFGSPAGVDPVEYKTKVFDHPRIKDLEIKFNAMHRVNRSYVKKNCRLIVDGMNDSLPGIFKFIDPKYDDLYMKRMWPAHISQIASFRYAKTTDLDHADRTYMNTDYPFVEELRGTEDEPNVVVFVEHPSEQAFHGLAFLVPQYKRFNVAFYQCDADELQQARGLFIKNNPEALKISNEVRKANGLPQEQPSDPTWYNDLMFL